MKIYDYVIYHKKCFDGFTGFVILHQSKTIKDNAQIYPDIPNAKSIPPNINNKNIIIIDVAYKYEILREIVRRAKYVTFIDHHITIYEDVKKISQEFKNIKIIYDKNKSGATLTWDFFNPGKKTPIFIKFIEDNDIGKWEMDNVYEFIAAINVKYEPTPTKNNLLEWKKLYSFKTVNELIKVGKYYIEYKDYIGNENSNRFSIERFPSEKIFNKFPKIFKKPGAYTIAVYCGSPCPSASDVAKRIFLNYKCDFFMSWVLNLDRKEYILTFRSEKIDVGEIAKAFNGGGHTLAASGSIKTDVISIEELFVGTSIQREMFKIK
jgi:oligoribonuclease NrnB/cAMP/cGMP phosphodiesterase (DHH superfamily)